MPEKILKRHNYFIALYNHKNQLNKYIASYMLGEVV